MNTRRGCPSAASPLCFSCALLTEPAAASAESRCACRRSEQKVLTQLESLRIPRLQSAPRIRTMTKTLDHDSTGDDEMRAEYDFRGGVRGTRWSSARGMVSSACVPSWTSPVRATRPRRRERTWRRRWSFSSRSRMSPRCTGELDHDPAAAGSFARGCRSLRLTPPAAAPPQVR